VRVQVKVRVRAGALGWVGFVSVRLGLARRELAKGLFAVRLTLCILEHINFICSTKDKGQNFFVTALADKTNENFEILINSRRGFEEKVFKSSDMDFSKGPSSL
jgi:hypothetical protein